MPLNTKVVCLDILALTFYTFFPLGGFEVFREILENVLKVYTSTRGSQGH
jgi:hypothetical protein